MTRLNHMLIAAVYGLAAVLIAVLVLVATASGALVALLAGAVVLLLGALAHETLARRAMVEVLRDEIGATAARLDGATAAVDGTRSQVAELVSALDAERDEIETRMSDVHELKGLVVQLATKLDSGRHHGRAKATASADAAPASGHAPEPAQPAAPAPVRMGPARLPPVPVPPPPPEPSFVLPESDLLDETLDGEQRQLLGRVREAIEARRADVLVQPIVRLPQRRVEYFEAFSRLRAADGSPILPEAYGEIAEQAGLVPAIAELLLCRCADLVRRDLERRSGFPYLCHVAVPDLSLGGYFRRFVDYLRSNSQLSHGIVLSFAAADFDLENREFLTLVAGLARDGYRLSIDGVQSLDMDFREIARRNVRFLKVAPELLMDGEDDPLAGDALKPALERAGIALVVERVDSESLLLELLDYDIDYGQGYLFGGLRKSF